MSGGGIVFVQNALTIGKIYIIIYIPKYNTTIQTVIFYKMRM